MCDMTCPWPVDLFQTSALHIPKLNPFICVTWLPCNQLISLKSSCCSVRQCIAVHCSALQCIAACMGWLRLVGSLKLEVSTAKEPYKRDCILQKRPVILRSLHIVATPQPVDVSQKSTLYFTFVSHEQLIFLKSTWYISKVRFTSKSQSRAYTDSLVLKNSLNVVVAAFFFSPRCRCRFFLLVQVLNLYAHWMWVGCVFCVCELFVCFVRVCCLLFCVCKFFVCFVCACSVCVRLVERITESLHAHKQTHTIKHL